MSTEPPQTEPPQTEPPQTEPPQTEPPQTEPPQTEPTQAERPRQDGQGGATRSPRLATYRVQLHAGFPFTDAAAIADYLAGLGVSHLYLSPILQAATGSTHGYDVVDPTRVNRELGGAEGYEALCRALGAAGIGQLLDVVPNHMAITGRDNAWWWDVLENGPASVYASYFDVDWRSTESKLTDIVLLPILGDHYGRELDAGHLRLQREGGSFVVAYYDNVAPVAPRSLDALLAAAAGLTDSQAGGPGEELESIATAFGRLPRATSTDTASVHERHRDKEILRTRLAALLEEHPALARAVDTQVDALNDDPDALDVLLSRQNFRLAWWRTAAEELDYRRFFDINDLAGLRVEDPEVFAASHQLVLGWLAAGIIDGLRIDHVDGLRDPDTYLERLCASAPGGWIVVEKIMEEGEELPERWPVAGTTGYDWLNTVGALLVDPSGSEALLAGYRAFVGEGADDSYGDLVHQAKLEVLGGPLSADLTRLVARLAAICEHHRRYRDYTRRDLRDAMTEVVAGFGVYRTYVAEGRDPDDHDIATVTEAVAAAATRRPDLDTELLGFLGDILLQRVPGGDERELALRFGQLTGPVMAKAVEDTAFYRYLPLTSANEVGGDPSHPALDVAGFHRACARLHDHHPAGLLALSTHDTKRSEDVRARISVLAEIPDEFGDAVRRWEKLADRHRSGVGPDKTTEWLTYQTLLGAWPLSVERLGAYLEKATREAKVHTSWTDPDPDYDRGLRTWAAALLDDGDFVADLSAFVRRVRRPGWANGLAQKLLTLTGPGVPDLYQGSELWDFSLVDPDNRRPVDYGARRDLLARTESVGAVEAWRAESGDGLTKLHVVRAALALRQAHPEWFGPGPAGGYQPIWPSGPEADHVVATRRGGTPTGGGVVSVVTRRPVTLERSGGWTSTTLRLPPGRWTDHLGGGAWDGEVPVGALLAGLPVALLAPTTDSARGNL